MAKNILITGVPGVGKTTLVQKLVSQLQDLEPQGFYTREIRHNGIRQGFELVDFNGNTSLLSHIKITSHYQVGKYGVDLDSLEKFLQSLDLSKSNAKITVIDEIGKMECLSQNFQKLLNDLLGSENLVLATIGLRGGGFIAEVKRRSDIDIVEITQMNRDIMYSKILEEILSL